MIVIEFSIFKQLCTTGVGNVRIWNVETGRMTRQLTVPKDQSKDTVVWSCAFLSNYTIVTGDSSGKVTFYDGKLGAVLHCYKTHDADILSVAMSKNERMIFVSGVDPLFLAFELGRGQILFRIIPFFLVD